MATEQDEIIQTTKDMEISVLNEKFADALAIPGFTIEFEPEEADRVGAFLEDALSEQDALESSIDREEW